MTRMFLTGWKSRLAVVAMLVAAAPAMASDKGVTKTAEPAPDHKVVDLFAAADSGDIEVRFIAKNAKEANVIVTNKSKEPLSIKMPEAFAGVPVLAQAPGGPAGAGGFGGMGGGNQGGFGGGNQGMGGGFGGGMMGGGMGGMGMGGGMFNIAPGKVGRVEVGIVCLEHGKEDPNPRIEYTIKPITSFTQDPKVIELCKLMAKSDMTQNVAQAAAWHLTDGLSWQELAMKDRVRLSNGYVEKYFDARELFFAQKAVTVATQLASEVERSATSTSAERAENQ